MWVVSESDIGYESVVTYSMKNRQERPMPTRVD